MPGEWASVASASGSYFGKVVKFENQSGYRWIIRAYNSSASTSEYIGGDDSESGSVVA